MFSPSNFRDLFQPNYCERRVWLAANRPELALEDVEFVELVKGKGQEVEDYHVQGLGPVEMPEYEPFDMLAGYEETLKLIKSKTPIIYQGVLITKDGRFVAVPDLLILEEATGRYRIRDVKLAVNLDNHSEILYGLGLCSAIAEDVLGYQPEVEVVTGDGDIITPLEVPTEKQVLDCIELIHGLESYTEEPFDPVGWSKCNVCSFFAYCWNLAWESRDVSTIPGIEQGMSRAIHAANLMSWDNICRAGIHILSEISFQRGKQTQRIGPTRGEKIMRQAKCLVENRHELIAPLVLPNGYNSGDRPVVIFDIENNIFEIGLAVSVYLWGLMVVEQDDVMDQMLVVAPLCDRGDSEGWHSFLGTMSNIFTQHGDIPLVHYSSHERTWVGNYVKRYGDVDGIAERILANLWDMYKAILSCVVLPVPSYSLKQIEAFVGFKRTQEDYGGSWSIVRYNEYLEAPDEAQAAKILDEIRTYNREDLLATYAVYKWLEEHCC